METKAANRLIATRSPAANAIFLAAGASAPPRPGCVRLLLAALLVAFSLPVSLPAQEAITTVAGLGTGGVTFNLPTGVAVDSSGNLYVADTQNCVVWKITNGVGTVFAGIKGNCASGAGTSANRSLAYPIDVAVCNNNVYFAAHGYDPVPSGQSLTGAVAGGVFEISSGTFSKLPMPKGPVEAISPLFPVSLACDTSGNVYLASYFYSTEVMFGGSVDLIPAGSQTTKNWIQESGIAYSGVTVDSQNNVFVLGTVGVGEGWLGPTSFAASGFIYQITGNGGATAVLTADIPNGLPNTSRLVSNGVGNFLVTAAASASKPTVYVDAVPGIGTLGIFSAVAGNGTAGYVDNVQANSAELDNATGLAVDSCGSIYVADSGNNVVREIVNTDLAGTAACTSSTNPAGSSGALSVSLTAVNDNGLIPAGGSLTFNSPVQILNCNNCTAQGEVFYCSFLSVPYTPPATSTSAPCQGGTTLGSAGVSPTGTASGDASFQATFLFPGTYWIVAEYYDQTYAPASTQPVPIGVCGASCTDPGAIPNIPIAAVPVALTPGALNLNFDSGKGMIALDAKDNRYFLNSAASTVQWEDLDNDLSTIVSASSTVAGGGTLGAMLNPSDIVVGSDGNLYITDTGNNRVIQVVDPTATLPAKPTITVINIGSSGGTLSPALAAPVGIFETGDEVYVTDAPASGPRLVAFRPDGSYPTTILNSATTGAPALGQLLGIAVNPTTLAIYVANSPVQGGSTAGNIIQASIGGSASVVSTGALTLQSPYGLAMDAAGGLYFSDTGTHQVYRMDVHGNVIVVAGNGTATESLGSLLFGEYRVSATQTGLANPTLIALDINNSLYINDESEILYLDATQSIVDFTATGQKQTIYVTSPVAATQGTVAMEIGTPVAGTGSTAFTQNTGTTCSLTEPFPPLSPNTSCELVLTLNPGASSGTVTYCAISQIETSLGPPPSPSPVSCLATPPDGSFVQNIYLNIAPSGATTLQISGALAQGAYNAPYAGVQFIASGGSGQYTFSLKTGSLPAGMNLSSTGMLSGTPTQGGSFPFTVSVSDAQGDTGSLAQTLVIDAAATTTTLSAKPNPVAAGQPLTLTAKVLYNSVPVVGGSVAFYNNSNTKIGQATTSASGTAILVVTSPATGGTYAYTATFLGTANLATSNGPASVVVTGSLPLVKVSITETILVADTPSFLEVVVDETIDVTDTVKVKAMNLTAAPTFSPVSGIYQSTQQVTISDKTKGAVIHYTTNGTTPTVASPRYTGPIAVNANKTIEAIAIAPGDAESPVAEAKYTIK